MEGMTWREFPNERLERMLYLRDKSLGMGDVEGER
jgi:hypothetical protein